MELGFISLQNIIKETKYTKFSSHRFIVPSDWFNKILNNSEPDQAFNNSIFLNTKKNAIKNKININEIAIVVYEIMDYIISLYNVDYIIIVKFDDQENKIDLEDVEIMTPKDFPKSFNSKFDKISVQKGYLTGTDFSVNNRNNLGDSTNELLNDAKQTDKEEKSEIIRKVNTSENMLSSKTKKELDKNQLNENKINDNKLSINSRNGNNNTNNSKEPYNIDKNMNTEELNPNEKFHNITQKYYRHLSLKDITQVKNVTNNKEEELDDKNKKYIFNESQLTINLNSFEEESIKPIGLVNPNIYCFMISVLQTLISIPELNYYFLTESYTNKNKEREEESDTPICDVYRDFIKQYLLEKKYMQIPRSLRIICNELLGGMRMHDCQEFLVCFLEALQDELNTKEKVNIPENITMEQKWILYRKVNYSFIDSVFTGLMRSTVQCKKCDSKSYTYDPFIDLSVSINKYRNIEKCLKQYFEKEKIDGDYKCEKCKQVSKVSSNIFYNIFIILGNKKIGYYDSSTYINDTF